MPSGGVRAKRVPDSSSAVLVRGPTVSLTASLWWQRLLQMEVCGGNPAPLGWSMGGKEWGTGGSLACSSLQLSQGKGWPPWDTPCGHCGLSPFHLTPSYLEVIRLVESPKNVSGCWRNPSISVLVTLLLRERQRNQPLSESHTGPINWVSFTLPSSAGNGVIFVFTL